MSVDGRWKDSKAVLCLCLHSIGIGMWVFLVLICIALPGESESEDVLTRVVFGRILSAVCNFIYW